MGILDKNFEKAIASTEASFIRGKMGVKKGNKFIQDLQNKVNRKKGSRYCGYD